MKTKEHATRKSPTRHRGQEGGPANIRPPNTLVSKWLLFFSVAVMWILGARHYTEEWGWYALLQGCLGYLGYVLLESETLGIGIHSFLPIGRSRGGIMEYTYAILWTFLALFGIYLTQLLAQFAATLEISAIEQALYHIFSGATETMFFQVALVKTGEVIGKAWGKWIAVAGQSLLFVAMHVNYYGNWPALEAVWACGLWLGVLYALTDDPTGVMAGHVLWNALLQSKYGVILSIEGSSLVTIVIATLVTLMGVIVRKYRQSIPKDDPSWKVFVGIMVLFTFIGVLAVIQVILGETITLWWF